MNGFERRKERKKESIRRAAVELFKVYGFKKVSINDIAQKAGVSHVTIYNHFGSKEELVREVVKAQLTSMVERYWDIIKGERPFPEKLEAIIFDKAKIVSQYQGELIATLSHNDPEIEQFIESLWRGEITQLLNDFLEEGKTQGYINSELPQEAFLVYFETLRRGVTANPSLLTNLGQNTSLFRELSHLFMYGLMGKE